MFGEGLFMNTHICIYEELFSETQSPNLRLTFEPHFCGVAFFAFWQTAVHIISYWLFMSILATYIYAHSMHTHIYAMANISLSCGHEFWPYMISAQMGQRPLTY